MDVKCIYGPAWIEGRLCAVGYIGAAFYPAHAREAATDHSGLSLPKKLQNRIVLWRYDDICSLPRARGTYKLFENTISLREVNI